MATGGISQAVRGGSGVSWLRQLRHEPKHELGTAADGTSASIEGCNNGGVTPSASTKQDINFFCSGKNRLAVVSWKTGFCRQ